MDSIDPADFPATLALLDRVGSKNVRDGLRTGLLVKWAETDPSAAMAYANTVTGRPSRDTAIVAVMQGWAEKDSAAALAWAQQLPPGQLRNQVLSAAVGALASKDPQAAFDLMKSAGLDNQLLRYGGLRQVFRAWAEKDPAAAIKGAESCSGEQRSQAFQAIALSWASKDPQAAITWGATDCRKARPNNRP